MQVSIRKILNKEKEQVIIECVEITPQIKDIYSYVQNKGTELSGMTEEQYRKKFRLEDVYYFEALDEKVFAYTKEQVYEIKMRLYEAEEAFKKRHFIRCSKSVVLNLMLLDSISPALNGRFFAHMKNGEKLMISRQYAKRLKQVVMGGNDNESEI
ncbi:MAG: LytTR family transcriptional regulator [Lachnospiraceae bacterium]|nr:LytTR family transcriptional regulator [Lachnospiraceae bacterium]